MWSVITPLVYKWVNIDTRGHTKSPKSQKILPGSDTPGHKGLTEVGFEIIITLYHPNPSQPTSPLSHSLSLPYIWRDNNSL